MSKKLTGIEAERAYMKSTASRLIEEILLQNFARERNTRKDFLRPPPIDNFTRLEPIGYNFDSAQEDWFFHPDDCTPDVLWPINVGLIANRGDDNPPLMSKVQTISPKKLRGVVHRFSPYMVKVDQASMIDGHYSTAAGIWVWLGGAWVEADDHLTYTKQDVPIKYSYGGTDKLVPLLATAAALRQRYHWAVALGRENTPSIRFETDPEGVKELFKLRDLGEGKKRRDALFNWVTDHWRQNRYDPDVEVYVRKHLRGANTFDWWDMKCELIPSQFDLDQRDKFIQEREALKLTGKDKRKRA